MIGKFDPEQRTVEKNGQWFDLGCQFEVDCHQLGRHDFGPDQYAGDDGQGGPDPTQGYHKCRHCFRIEPL